MIIGELRETAMRVLAEADPTNPAGLRVVATQDLRAEDHQRRGLVDYRDTIDWAMEQTPEPERPAYLQPTTTDRGFDHMPPIASTYGGHVRGYESSAASGPHIWLYVDDAGRSMGAHLTVADTRKFAEQLLWLADHHYQGNEEG